MKFIRIMLITIFMFGVCGCGNTIRMYGPEVVPTPNVDVPPVNETMALDFSKKVEDMLYDDHSNLKYMEIYNWREMLTTGFNNAFEEFNLRLSNPRPVRSAWGFFV